MRKIGILKESRSLSHKPRVGLQNEDLVELFACMQIYAVTSERVVARCEFVRSRGGGE